MSVKKDWSHFTTACSSPVSFCPASLTIGKYETGWVLFNIFNILRSMVCVDCTSLAMRIKSCSYFKSCIYNMCVKSCKKTKGQRGCFVLVQFLFKKNHYMVQNYDNIWGQLGIHREKDFKRKCVFCIILGL